MPPAGRNSSFFFVQCMKAYSHCSDAQIWQAMKGGDPEAVCRMMEKSYQVLYRYGLKLSAGDETLTKDCIQEVFIKLWNNRSGLGDVTLIKPYLLTAFRRRLLDGLAARRPALMPLYLPGEEDAAFPQAVTYSCEDDLIRDQERERTGNRLARALDNLPKRQREAVYLRYYENMEYSQIAQVMALKERSVYNLVHEGLNKLRQELRLAVTFLEMLSVLALLAGGLC
jgi:RNA polymerase sigma factor (sigma-70 family)